MKHKKILSALTAFALLPASAGANVNYTVQKGDSYWLVSQKFNTSLNEVLSANNAAGNTSLIEGQRINVPSNVYTVQKGDTYYLIAKKCSVSLESLLNLNGAFEKSVIYPGDIVKIPEENTSFKSHIVQKGDTYWKISQKYDIELEALLAANNALSNTYLDIGDIVKIPPVSSENGGNFTGGAPYVTYKTYTVQKNDTLWNIAVKCSIPFAELLSANSLSENDKIYEGMLLTVPVHHIPVKSAPKGYGELLEWFEEAQYVVPINADFKVVDLETGKSFNARRTVGAGHADCEPLSARDTEIMKDIWGGTLTWNKRSVLVVIGGRTVAASAAGYLHAGNENAPGGAWTSQRSGNYGAGINYDYVKGNNADGHFDLHFYKSIGHSSGVENSAHQKNVLKSAGM